jgi:PGF-CTERM protein
MMDEEDTPGFTLVAASAALGMAMFVNQRRVENDDE